MPLETARHCGVGEREGGGVGARVVKPLPRRHVGCGGAGMGGRTCAVRGGGAPEWLSRGVGKGARA